MGNLRVVVQSLFFDGKSGEIKKQKQKSATEDADSTHGDHEHQIKKITLKLADMHGEKYNDNQFKWMMVNKQHDDMIFLILPILLVE